MDINKTAKEYAEKNAGKSLEQAFMDGFIYHSTFVEEVRVKKEQKLAKLKKQFADELRPFLPMYGKEVLNDFYGYWSQPNQSKTNIGRYMQKTWDTSLRLQNWMRNAKPNTQMSKEENTPQKKYKEI